MGASTALMGASTAMQAMGSISSAMGSSQSAGAQAGAYTYNSEIAQQNQEIANQNAELASESGEQQAAAQELKNRATVGSIKANQAASGIDVNQGSAVDVRASAAELGQLDAMNIRAEAARQAYAYQNQAQSYGEQSALDLASASNAKGAGRISETSTILGGLTSASANWARYMQNGSTLSTSDMGSGTDSYMGPY